MGHISILIVLKQLVVCVEDCGGCDHFEETGYCFLQGKRDVLVKLLFDAGDLFANVALVVLVDSFFAAYL